MSQVILAQVAKGYEEDQRMVMDVMDIKAIDVTVYASWEVAARMGPADSAQVVVDSGAEVVPFRKA